MILLLRKFVLLFNVLLFAVLLGSNCIAALTVNSESTVGSKPLKTAIFIRNNGGKELAGDVNTFTEMLSAKLSSKGFSIMSWQDIIQKLSESNETDEQIFQNARNLMKAANTDVADNTDSPINSSSLRISQMIGADYLIVASMGTLGHEKRTFKGKGTIYKTDNSADIYTMPMTARVLVGNTGASIYGDSLIASTTIYQNAGIEIEMNNIVDKIINSGTTELSNAIGEKIDEARKIDVKQAALVNFSVGSNISGATVELDGTAIGSTPGTFEVSPGVHQMRITREYFEPWERTVNIYPGQKLNVTLELSKSGMAKYKDITAFNQDQELQKMETTAAVDIAKEQSKADADAKEKISSGQEEYYKNSYIRSDGFADQLEKVIHGSGWF